MASYENDETEFYSPDEVIFSGENERKVFDHEMTIHSSVRENVDYASKCTTHSDFPPERDAQLAQNFPTAEDNLKTENVLGNELEIAMEVNDVSDKLTPGNRPKESSTHKVLNIPLKITDSCKNLNDYYSDVLASNSSSSSKQNNHLDEISETQTNVSFQCSTGAKHNTQEETTTDNRSILSHYLCFDDGKQDVLPKLEEHRTQNLLNSQDIYNGSLKDSDRALEDANTDTESSRPAKIKKQFYRPWEDSLKKRPMGSAIPQIKVHTDQVPSTSRSLSIIPGLPTQKGALHTLSDKLNQVLKKHDKLPFECTDCDRSFKSGLGLAKHLAYIHGKGKYRCKICDEIFSSNYYLKQHRIRCHRTEYECCMCSAVFWDLNDLNEHKNRNHSATVCVPTCMNCIQNLFRNNMYTIEEH